ncbi:TetR/AcrR family transcriptional regulator [Nocardia sp. NPDC020380]|uniref:TetR/AcrR family transcriptional regulator n=1 Tax=Nocardia sp. NPDC020380 TaxID=3364309 RepID=UPI0037AC3471
MESEETVEGHRERIVAAAARLLTEGGPDAVSTRAVSTAAGVQPPTIYRLFGDKQGLLDAVAAHGFAAYLATKTTREPTGDPIEDLRTGWDLHVGLGLADPALYTLMYTRPGTGAATPAAVTAFAMLAALIRRIAEAGRLRIPEERAAALVHAAGSGTTLALIATPEGNRDPELSSTAREAVIAAITTGSAGSTTDSESAMASPASTTAGAASSTVGAATTSGGVAPATAAVTLRALLPRVEALTMAEVGLLREWLDRIAGHTP